MRNGLIGTFATAVVLALMVTSAFVIDVQSDNPDWYALPIAVAVVCAYTFAVLAGKAMRHRSW